MAANLTRRTTLPAVTSLIEDFGLGVSPEPSILNDAILVIGTSADGPLREPIPVLNKDTVQVIFGAFGNGTLVRGIYEALDATIEGTPDIRAVRIGDGEKAVLEIDERLSSSATADTQTDGHNSLKLEAIYPGSKYNAISIFMDEYKLINIYNPKTGVVTKISYDDKNPNNTAVDARNVSELVEVINADPNLSQAMIASASGISTEFEIDVNTTSSGVALSNSKLVLTLPDVLQWGSSGDDIVATGYIFDATATATAGNLIDQLEEVFSISVSDATLLETKGLTTVNTSLTPFDGKGDSRYDTIQALEDYNDDDRWMHNPSGTVVSEYAGFLDREVLTNVTTTGTMGAFSADLAVPGMLVPPDDSQEPTVSGTAALAQSVTTGGATTTSTNRISGNIALAWANALSGTNMAKGYVTAGVGDIDAGINDYVYTTSSGFEDALTYPGQIIVEVSETGGTSDSEWSPLFYHAVSGVYVSGFVVSGGTGTISLAVGTNATGYIDTGNLVTAGLVTTSGTINADRYLRITCNTLKGELSEMESLSELNNATDDWTSYFFKGKELVFSDTVPFDIMVNYGVKVNYEPGSDVIISDAANGELKFQSSTQPGPAGGALDATKRSIIGLKYKHLPQFPAITTTAQSLDGGTNGTEMNNQTLYDELDTTYTALENYQTQIIVPMGANLDATKDGYNSITGLPESVNAQFQVQLHTFLDALSMNVNETIGIIGVEQANSDSLADVNTWVKRLTIQDLNDPLRGANIMPLLGSRYLSVTAFEPVFDNLGGLPYTANGQAAYAGMISSLQPHHSPTNKSMPNANRTRFKLSNSQLEALLAGRFVTMREKPGGRPAITSAITAATPGSDFVRLSTVRITFAAMDVVRKVCDPFIGQPNSLSKRNAMEAAITKGLKGMQDVGALRKYAFTVSASADQQVLGIVDVDLILVPVFEIQQIRTTVKLRGDISQT